MRAHRFANPEARSTAPVFYVGKDLDGNRVIRDRSGMRGGLFVSREAALRFAFFEGAVRARAVVPVPGVLELGFGRREATSERIAAGP